MVNEDYVSFETAKLLKDKGFDWMCNGYYNKDDEISEPYYGDGEGADNWNNQASSVRDLWFSAPTLQMTMKWLREKHIVIIPEVETFSADGSVSSWEYHIWCDDNYEEGQNSFSSYEEACEEAIKFCLNYVLSK